MEIKKLIPIICLLLALIILGAGYFGKKASKNIKIPKTEITKNEITKFKSKPKTDKQKVVKEEKTNQENIITPVVLSKNDNKNIAIKPTHNEIYQLKSEKDFKYQNHVLYSILKNWSHVSKNTNADFSMIIRINQDGNIISYGILKQSEDKNFQDKAIKSVLQSIPYQKFKSDLEFITYQVVFRGNDVRIGIYKTNYELPYKVKYKKIEEKPFDFEQTLVKSTVASAPGKYAYKIPSNMPILRNWAPPLDSPSIVNIGFDVTKEGIIKNEKIISSSGSKDAPQAALKAIKNAKFDNLSEDIPDIKYWFEVKKSMW